MTNGLKFLNGPQESEVVAVSVEKFIIGRDADCSLQLPSNLVSRHHCAIIQDNYTIRLRDLGSKNGTYVNGFKIAREKQLKTGDIITVGGIALKFDLDSETIKSESEVSLEDTGIITMSNTVIDSDQEEVTKICPPEEVDRLSAPHVVPEGATPSDMVITGDEELTDFDID